MAAEEPVSTRVLRNARVGLQTGLTDLEADAAQERYGFTFLPEHREFLQRHLPVGTGWPDWRNASSELREQLEWPVEGVLLHVESDDFWAPTWGPRPAEDDAAVATARARMAVVPRLIPVFGHRYLPAAPAPAPAPVFSVYQSDVIRYGDGLDDYLLHEFSGADRSTPPAGARIPFWDDLAGDWS